MAWSAKLQSGTGGTTGYNEWELVYSPSAQESYKIKYGFSLGNQAPDVLYHTPDNGSPVPVQATGANRLIFLTVDVPKQANWDTVNEKVAALARLIDGPYSQAVRAQTTGDANKVRVAIKPDGATYTTYYEVLHGFMDTSQAFTESAAVLNTMARNITIALTCAPFGYGDSFTLKNMLASSPHMLVDSNADGLADGWADYGTPTETVISTLYLIGGYSQKVTADSGSGITTAVVTASTSTDLVGYVWVYSSAMSGFQMSLRDGSNNAIQSVTCTAANADKTAIDNGGRTWYRFKAAGQNTTAVNARLSITSTSAGKVFYVDGAYLTTGTQTAPPAFSSGSNLVNRYDPTVATTNINYLDVWGIPGDVPAFSDILIEPGTGDATRFFMGAFADGVLQVTSVEHWHDTSGWSTVSGTWTTGTGTISNHYHQCSTTAGVIRKTSNVGVAYARQAWRVFVLAYTSDLSATIQASYYTSGDVLITSSRTGSLTDVNEWQFVDLGILNLQGILNENSTALNEYITISQAASQTIRIDGILYIPTQLGMTIADSYDSTAAPRVLDAFYDSKTQLVYDASIYLKTAAKGRIPLPLSGNKVSRYIFAVAEKVTNKVTITTGLAVTLTITPRTSHLLGTK